MMMMMIMFLPPLSLSACIDPTQPAACLECLTVCRSQKNPEIGAVLLSWGLGNTGSGDGSALGLKLMGSAACEHP